VAAWVRRDTDSGVDEQVLRFLAGVGAGVSIDTSDLLIPRQGFTTGGTAGAIATATWYYITLRFTSGGDQRCRILADGDTAWQTLSINSGGGDETLTNLTLASSDVTVSNPMAGTFASYKLWTGTLPTEDEVLTERLNTSVTVTTGLFASYDFLTGELATDRSGNARDLTLVATPTFTSDKPTDLTIGGGGGGSITFDEDYQISLPVISGW
jgi:hypothetical protein